MLVHMLRVVACSYLIIDNWNGPEIDKEAIIRVCLLHDMGNIVKIPEDDTIIEGKCIAKRGAVRKKTLLGTLV